MATPTPSTLKPAPRADGFIDNPNGKIAGDWGYDKNGTPFLPNGTVFLGMGGGTPVANPITAITALPDFLGKLSNRYLWERIGLGVMGALFIWWGVLAFLATNKKVGSAVIGATKTAVSKTPQGALANLASDAIGS